MNTIQTIRNALAFLERVNLTGKEAIAYAEVVNYLNVELEKLQPQIED